MAHYTPYAQEGPLDLSSKAVKEPRASPLPASSAPQFPVMSEPYYPYPYTYPSYTESQYHATYHAAYTPVPTSAISPDSMGSSHSKPSAPSPPASLSDDLEYQAFERDAFRAMAEKNGGSLVGNNPRMRRAVLSQTTQTADESYRRQRERNNYAAKQSRDRRKLREARLAFQVTFLKKKMDELRARLAAGVCGRCGQMCQC